MSNLVLLKTKKKEKQSSLTPESDPNPNPIEIIDSKINDDIKTIYSRLRGNFGNINTLIQERHDYVLKLDSLYKRRIKLGTLQIKKYQIARQIYKDLILNDIPQISYSSIVKLLGKSSKRPYHFRKVDATHAIVTEIDEDKQTEIETKEEMDVSEYTRNGTHREISNAYFHDLLSAVKDIESQSLESIADDQVKSLYDKIKNISETTKRYCKLFNIKIDDTDKSSSLSLLGTKPKFRKNLLTDELGLLAEDITTMKKFVGKLNLEKDEEYIAWEAVRSMRLWIRPHVNQKYRFDWDGYSKIMNILKSKGISGVAKDTKSPVKVWNPKLQKYEELYEMVKQGKGVDKKSLIKIQKKMKGITRNHLRNMIPKCNNVYVDFITDFPFFRQFATLFESHMKPIRDGKALMVSEKH